MFVSIATDWSGWQLVCDELVPVILLIIVVVYPVRYIVAVPLLFWLNAFTHPKKFSRPSWVVSLKSGEEN